MITYRFSIIKQEIDAYVLHKLSLVRASIRLLSAHTPASLPKLTKKIISQQTKAPQKDLRRDLGTRVFNEANPNLPRIFLFGCYLKGCFEKRSDGSHKHIPRRSKFCYSRAFRMYSWIADQRDAHEKLICKQTRRVTIVPRPRIKSSQRGEFRPSGFHFL